jgi:hypothetical protein
LSAIHIPRILKVSRTWLLTIEKQSPEGAPKDFEDADRSSPSNRSREVEYAPDAGAIDAMELEKEFFKPRKTYDT